MRARFAWGVLMTSENSLDGFRSYLLGTPDHPCRTKLFFTREEARKFVNEQYGCIRNRPDLRREPHGWRMPKAVRVSIAIAGERAAAEQYREAAE